MTKAFAITIEVTADLFSKEINLEKFMAKNPVLVGRSCDILFYEHPIHGDEVALIAVHNGKCGYSHWHDVPDAMELAA